jgi:Putative peptidoglycan binding domain
MKGGHIIDEQTARGQNRKFFERKKLQTKEIWIMKTKFIWVALLASAAFIAQAQADGHHGGGGGGGGHAAPSGVASVRSGGVPSFHGMPMRNFGDGRMMSPGQRFSSIDARRFNSGNFNRGDRFARFDNNSRVMQDQNNFSGRNGAIANRGNGGSIGRSGNNLPAGWRNHVAARHSADWHRDWDRGRDHRWHGHHCRFVNGSWVIFDLGFYPWWSYGYPYDYGYGYDYYPGAYGFDPGYYYDSGFNQDGENYDGNGYGYGDQDTNPTVAAVQERLARRGYYRGEIDGVLGPETRRAISRYQRSRGLHVTGDLTLDTLRGLGLQRLAAD